MSACNSSSSSKLTLLQLRRDLSGVSDDVYTDRLLAYKPIVSPEAKPDPLHLNTKGKAHSGRNVGRLADLLKMPPDVFHEVSFSDLSWSTAKIRRVDCFVSSPIGYSSSRTCILEDPGRPDVAKLVPCLDRREEGAWYARVSPRSQ